LDTEWDSAAIAKELHTWLMENPGKSAREIGEKFGLSESQFCGLLMAAEKHGVLFYEEMQAIRGRYGSRRQIAYFSFEDKPL
jgi:hypothetical protein